MDRVCNQLYFRLMLVEIGRVINDIDLRERLRLLKIARVWNNLDLRLRLVKLAIIFVLFGASSHLSRVRNHLEPGIGESGLAGHFAVWSHCDGRRCHSWLRHFAFHLISLHLPVKFIRLNNDGSFHKVEIRPKILEGPVKLFPEFLH